ncbi:MULTISPECIES: DUF167 family protein [unclassified Pannonibacter]|uniref:DUF167 family protein n=1 Tax=unclassified Pannonibacter TaxID=2627228 RepID=UPI0016442D21|nr:MULTISPECIES: DUF167 family protein [unclassified Pannonibacter]
MTGPERPWRPVKGGVSVDVRLTPRSGHDRVDGLSALSDGRQVLAARVRAVPEKGAANAALEVLMAKTLGLPKSAVSLAAGSTARIKTLHVTGEPDTLMAALEAVCGG